MYHLQKTKKNMNNTIAISISYKKSGETEYITKAIDEIKHAFGDDFLLHIKPNPGTQAMGLIDAMIELSSNISLGTFLSILKNGVEYYVAYKILWEGFKKVFKKMEAIEAETEHWDYSCVKIKFDDCDIIIYGYENIFRTAVPFVFNMLLASRKKLFDTDLGVPYEIHIPIQKDEDNNNFTREDCPDDLSIDSYRKYWGIVYNYGYDRRVYDVKNEKLLSNDWY